MLSRGPVPDMITRLHGGAEGRKLRSETFKEAVEQFPNQVILVLCYSYATYILFSILLVHNHQSSVVNRSSL